MGLNVFFTFTALATLKIPRREALSDAADANAEKDIHRFYRVAAHNAAVSVIAITGTLARPQ